MNQNENSFVFGNVFIQYFYVFHRMHSIFCYSFFPLLVASMSCISLFVRRHLFHFFFAFRIRSRMWMHRIFFPRKELKEAIYSAISLSIPAFFFGTPNSKHSVFCVFSVSAIKIDNLNVLWNKSDENVTIHFCADKSFQDVQQFFFCWNSFFSIEQKYALYFIEMFNNNKTFNWMHSTIPMNIFAIFMLNFYSVCRLTILVSIATVLLCVDQVANWLKTCAKEHWPCPSTGESHYIVYYSIYFYSKFFVSFFVNIHVRNSNFQHSHANERCHTNTLRIENDEKTLTL